MRRPLAPGAGGPLWLDKGAKTLAARLCLWVREHSRAGAAFPPSAAFPYHRPMATRDPVVCSKCQYELMGLPPVGICPECGARYNMTTGQGVSQRGDIYRGERLFARLRTILLAIIAVLILGCGGTLGVVLKNQRPFAVGALLAAIFFLAALTSFVYERDEG